GNLQLGTERCLRDADGNCAIQIGAAAFEERVLFDLEHDVQIAGWTAIRPRFAFTADAQTRAGIDAGRNTQLDRFFFFDAALPAAIGAALLDHLARALASG